MKERKEVRRKLLKLILSFAHSVHFFLMARMLFQEIDYKQNKDAKRTCRQSDGIQCWLLTHINLKNIK